MPIVVIPCVFVWAFFFVLYHPGINRDLDKLRLEIQIPIMKSLSDYLIDWEFRKTFWLIHENNFFEKDPDMISWNELENYLWYLKRGDIIFTDGAKYISSIIIPWTWKHTLLYLWSWEIIDATAKWVSTWLLVDVDNLSRWSLLRSIIAFRPNLTVEQIENMISFTYDKIWKPYDFDYDKEDKDAYYCSELIKDSLSWVWINISYESESVWKMVVSPEDMVNYISEIWIPNGEFDIIFHLKKDDNFELVDID